jgi:hypothetical protein
VLAEKILQFKLPASHSVRIPAGETQVHAVSFYPDFSRKACSAIGKNKLTCYWSE